MLPSHLIKKRSKITLLQNTQGSQIWQLSPIAKQSHNFKIIFSVINHTRKWVFRPALSPNSFSIFNNVTLVTLLHSSDELPRSLSSLCLTHSLPPFPTHSLPNYLFILLPWRVKFYHRFCSVPSLLILTSIILTLGGKIIFISLAIITVYLFTSRCSKECGIMYLWSTPIRHFELMFGAYNIKYNTLILWALCFLNLIMKFSLASPPPHFHYYLSALLFLLSL